eukprot:6489399-Amphidinium_carterae.1
MVKTLPTASIAESDGLLWRVGVEYGDRGGLVQQVLNDQTLAEQSSHGLHRFPHHEGVDDGVHLVLASSIGEGIVNVRQASSLTRTGLPKGPVDVVL